LDDFQRWNLKQLVEPVAEVDFLSRILELEMRIQITGGIRIKIVVPTLERHRLENPRVYCVVETPETF